ncbi:uncharacterized protein LOC113330951 [Papaver somniferum]|uniref:uncharacterized protein LOC113330951 n=1 Tax=Papaver somniferum TaxID=3469 RepID=UPI000E6FDF63|nr:uncharacterized protein LOC113330951 [Papaver somniferum]
MGKVLGTPIVVDQRTLNLEYGNFASVLVDVDFAKHIPSRIKITAGGRTFWQYLEIPRAPKFCMKCCIIGHNDDECRRQTKGDDNSSKADTTAKGDSSKGWQTARNRRQRKGKNAENFPGGDNASKDAEHDASKNAEQDGVLAVLPGEVEENAIGVEETNQLENELASSEAVFHAASVALEKAKQALAEKGVLASRLPVGEIGTSAKSVGSGELARTNHSITDKTNASSSSAPFETSGRKGCDVVVDNIENLSRYKAINENDCVLSPNKFNVLSAELGLDSVQQSNEQREESSDEEITPEKASSGVRGSKWSDIPMEQPKKSRNPVRIRISNNQKSTSQQSTNKESKSDSETEINDLGIRVRKGFSPVILKRNSNRIPDASNNSKNIVS